MLRMGSGVTSIRRKRTDVDLVLIEVIVVVRLLLRMIGMIRFFARTWLLLVKPNPRGERTLLDSMVAHWWLRLQRCLATGLRRMKTPFGLTLSSVYRHEKIGELSQDWRPTFLPILTRLVLSAIRDSEIQRTASSARPSSISRLAMSSDDDSSCSSRSHDMTRILGFRVGPIDLASLTVMMVTPIAKKVNTVLYLILLVGTPTSPARRVVMRLIRTTPKMMKDLSKMRRIWRFR